MLWRAGYLTDQAQRQLLSIGPAEAPDEFFKTRRHIRKLEVAAPLQFFSDIFGDIARRALGGVKANDAHGVRVLASQKIVDNGAATIRSGGPRGGLRLLALDTDGAGMRTNDRNWPTAWHGEAFGPAS
jgi:hypothetical protein